MNSQRWTMFALVLPLTAWIGASAASPSSARTSAMPAEQGASPGSGDIASCPVRAADFDKLTPYRWKVAQYKADRVFIPSVTIRIDYCELIGTDDKGLMRTGVMVNIAKGANAEAFAKHWHAVCAESLMPEARGKVQPIPGVPGGQRCVTANGRSDVYWIETAGRTIQVEPENDGAAWPEILPRLLAAAGRG